MPLQKILEDSKFRWQICSCISVTVSSVLWCSAPVLGRASERSPSSRADGERHVLPWPCKITPQGPFAVLNDTQGLQLSSPDPCHRNTVDTDRRAQTSERGHKHHLQLNTQTHTDTQAWQFCPRGLSELVPGSLRFVLEVVCCTREAQPVNGRQLGLSVCFRRVSN